MSTVSSWASPGDMFRYLVLVFMLSRRFSLSWLIIRHCFLWFQLYLLSISVPTLAFHLVFEYKVSGICMGDGCSMSTTSCEHIFLDNS
jgi:hypothetical protein